MSSSLFTHFGWMYEGNKKIIKIRRMKIIIRFAYWSSTVSHSFSYAHLPTSKASNAKLTFCCCYCVDVCGEISIANQNAIKIEFLLSKRRKKVTLIILSVNSERLGIRS